MKTLAKYVTDDGVEFDSLTQAQRHERNLTRDKVSEILHAINNKDRVYIICYLIQVFIYWGCTDQEQDHLSNIFRRLKSMLDVTKANTEE